MNMEQPWMINPQNNPPLRPQYEKQPQMSENEAYSEIMGIYTATMQFGANDYESSAFMEILHNLKNHTIAPEEAVKKAYYIQNSKNAYH